MGGAIAAVHEGFYREALTSGAYQQQRALESEQRIVVGVNRYQQDETVAYPRFKVSEDSERHQLARLRNFRERRDADRVASALGDLAAACRSTDNVLPAVIAAVWADATLGEICTVWREVFGEYREETVAL